jgi:predicted nuclease with TOPRIM domain
MEQSEIQEILHALKLHSAHIDEKFDRMEERFDRIESKLNGFRVELTETQETVNYLTIKNAQHEKKLRTQTGQ